MAFALCALLALAGCGDGGETTPDPGEGGGGSAPRECTLDDSFDPAACPAIYPEWDCVAYVDRDVAASGDGWSWQSAVKTIQEGIDRARCGAMNAGVCEQWQVWVKQGRHFIHRGCREDTVWLRPHVGVYGGFTGTESTLAERDWAANPTVLDGRDGPEEGAGHVYHVVVGADDAVLDGFTVQHGHADHPDDVLHRSGGGMGNLSSSPIVQNCVFRHNVAAANGGGMANQDGSSPEVTGCTFVDNQAGEFGGGMESRANSSPTLTDCVFAQNHAGTSGGALGVGEGSLVVHESSFRNNSADDNGGAISVWQTTTSISGSILEHNTAAAAAGLAVWDSDFTMADCTLRLNRAESDPEHDIRGNGGGMSIGGSTATFSRTSFVANECAADGAGLSLGGDASATLTDCTFRENVATGAGGAIMIWGASAVVESGSFAHNEAVNGSSGAVHVGGEADATIEASTFRNNGAGANGGAVGVSSSGGLVLTGSELSNNVATNAGGGLVVLAATATVVGTAVHSNEASTEGGGLAMGQGAVVDVENSTFHGNSADVGGAIEAYSAGPLSLLHCTVAHNTATTSGGAISGVADLTVTNSIIWGPSESLIADSGSVAQAITYSNFPGGELTGSNNTGAMPTFVGPGRGDLHLQSTSECIDAADGDAAPATDLDGNARVGAPDMGAYEFQGGR